MTLSNPSFISAGEATKLPVFGVDVEVLLDGAASGGLSAVYRCTAQPGVGAPLHRHSAQDEMFHGLEGEFELICGDECRRLGPGDFAFVPRGLAHAFRCVGEKTGRLLVFSTPAGHEAFFRDCAEAIAAGTFSPVTGGEICRRHGIELLGAP